MSSEDEAILEVARRTSDIIGLTGSSPTTVSWQTLEHPPSRSARVVTPCFPAFEGEKLIISPIVQGRIAPEDWGPILAPSLIFYRRLWKSYSIGALMRVLPVLLLLLGIAFSSIFIPHLAIQLIVGFITGIIFMTALGAYSSKRWGRSLVLKADRKAALAIGTQSLIEVLRKLESLRELDEQEGRKWPEYGDHPSITKRIANLQSV